MRACTCCSWVQVAADIDEEATGIAVAVAVGLVGVNFGGGAADSAAAVAEMGVR